MIRVYLITHAHTAQQPGAPAELWDLSARGQAEAAQLAQAAFWPEVDRIVVSSERKTRLTVAALLAERALPVSVDCRFDEARRGGWEANYAEAVARFFAEPETAHGEWESAASVRRRAAAGLAHLADVYRGQTLALVGHGLGLSLLRAHVARLATADFDLWQRLSFAATACITADPAAIVTDFVPAAQGMR